MDGEKEEKEGKEEKEEKEQKRVIFRKRPARPKGPWPSNHPASFPPVINSTNDSEEWSIVDDKGEQIDHRPNLALHPSLVGEYSGTLTFSLNGTLQVLDSVDPDMKLVAYLRGTAGLTGTKIGCAEGGCGACTVFASRKDSSGVVHQHTINSCLRPLASLDGWAITTVEGIGCQKDGFHPVQSTLAKGNGSQCGYCSPGMVMQMYGLLQENGQGNPLSEQEIEDRFDGNICRCTGYRPILQSMRSFAKDGNHTKIEFPVCLEDYKPKPLFFPDPDHVYLVPITLTQVFALLALYSDTPLRLTSGNTSIGVIKYYPKVAGDDPSVFIDISRIPELASITDDTKDGYLQVGSAVSLNQLIAQLEQCSGSASLAPLVRHLKFVANVPVRNVATWAGNMMMTKTHPDFASDVVLMMTAARALVCVQSSSSSEEWMTVPEFLASPTASTSLLTALKIPYPAKNAVFDTWKVAQRHGNSHALVNAGFHLDVDGNEKITGATIVYGNIARGLLQCTKTQDALIGQQISGDLFIAAMQALKEECVVAPTKDTDPTWLVVDPVYRKSLALSLFYKFFLGALSSQQKLPAPLQTAATHYVRPLSKGVQVYDTDEKEAPVSEAITKLAAYRQASGEAKYTMDVAEGNSNMFLFAAPVQSTKPKAAIDSIDASAAMAMDGVVDFVSATTIKDLGANNECGMFPGDEEIFASTQVVTVGQTIGLIIAESSAVAIQAAKKVVVTYKDEQKPILTVSDAVAAKSFMPSNKYVSHVETIETGDVDSGFAAADHVDEGKLYSNDQIHFYMETQSAFAMPGENGVWHVESASQDPWMLRGILSTTFNLPQNKIITKTRRCGGAFGGKISRNITHACAVMVAAMKHNRPIAMQLDRNADMNTTGGREGMLANYKVGYMNDGTIKAYQVDFFSNGGMSYDGSLGDMDMCLYWADNTYFVPNFKVNGTICRLNRPSTTSMRAPGTVQSQWVMEHVLEFVANAVSKTPDTIRELNFYTDGQNTPYNQPLSDVVMTRVWDTLKTQCDYDNAVKEVQDFNSQNRWRKRGIRLLPCKYGMQPSDYFEACMLSVNPDGSVAVCHSGIELGQGIDTKVVQTVAMGLGVDMDTVEITKPSTDRIPKAFTTGGSATSESCVNAAVNACSLLNTALEPIRAKLPSTATWTDIITAAGAAHVCLQTTGWHGPPPPKYFFDYFVYNAACSMVEVDILTGEVTILKTDIVYDCGQSLNPAIDIGQIEGAFVQGVGYFFTEDVVTNNTTGRLITNGTWEYKPPMSKDIPIEFNVSLLKKDVQPSGTILGSKGVAEPPYLLAASAYFAARDCIQAARTEIGNTDRFVLSTPLSPDIIQSACLVDPSQFVTK